MAGTNIMGFSDLLGQHIQGKDSSFFKLDLLVMQMQATQETVILHEHILSSGQ